MIRKLVTGALLLISLIGLACNLVGDGCPSGESQTYNPNGPGVICQED